MICEDITPSCSSFSTCHAGAVGAGQLKLDVDPYAALVGVESPTVAGKIRVVAGDPDASYIMEKLTSATPADGTQMPPGAPLDAERLELVRGWIADGAPDN